MAGSENGFKLSAIRGEAIKLPPINDMEYFINLFIRLNLGLYHSSNLNSFSASWRAVNVSETVIVLPER